jgi:hypothetical protein
MIVIQLSSDNQVIVFFLSADSRIDFYYYIITLCVSPITV